MISISILGIKDNIIDNYKKLDQTTCDSIHIDIMDNKFVSNTKEYEVDYIFSKPKDIHLMVEDVDSYIDKYKYLNPSYITFHVEVKQDIDYLINKIKSNNIKVGLAIKPNTSIDALYPYLDKIDLVLVMSVEPGYGGQKYIESSTDKIDKLKELQKDYNYIIEVDGGINEETIIKACNADLKVVGNYVTASPDYQKNIDIIKRLEN